MHVLCGDIGGTHCRFLVADVDGATPRPVVEKHYPSADFPAFEDVLQQFLQELDTPPASACFAVAGPVESGRARITNLTWEVDAATLQQRFALPRVELINDFTAVAYGITALEATDFRIIQRGRKALDSPRVILGAGTGLGVAQSIYHQGDWQVLASQGGHAGFSPANAAQRDLLQWLSVGQDHVSNEDLLSGNGLVTLYRFYADRSGQADTAPVQRILAMQDPAAAVSRQGMEGSDTIARDAMNEFMRIYAAVAGDLALFSLAFGGVYIAGGIAPKIADHLDSDLFRRAFCRKGPMSQLMADFPVSIVMNDSVGLLGAALYAGHRVR